MTIKQRMAFEAFIEAEPEAVARLVLGAPAVLSAIQRERGRRGGLSRSQAKLDAVNTNLAKGRAQRKEAGE